MTGDAVEKTLGKLEFSIHEALRYLYGGLVCLLVAVVVDSSFVKEVRDALGPMLCLIAALALGVAVYTLYRPIVGEGIFRIQEWLHSRSRFHKTGCTCRTRALMDVFGVKTLANAGRAFRVVRDSKYVNQALQRRYYLPHSELHAVFITAIATAVGSLVLWSRHDATTNDVATKAILLGSFSAFALLTGVIGNMQLCTQECKTILQADKDAVRALLEQTECIEKRSGS